METAAVSHPSRPQGGVVTADDRLSSPVSDGRSPPKRGKLRKFRKREMPACEACLKLSRKWDGCFLLRVEEEDAPTVGEWGREL